MKRAAKTLHGMSPCTPVSAPAKISWIEIVSRENIVDKEMLIGLQDLLFSVTSMTNWTQGVLVIFIYGGVRMKGQIQAQKYGFIVNFASKNIVILHIFCPKIWVTILF